VGMPVAARLYLFAGMPGDRGRGTWQEWRALS
jgi:hypothetical protein